MKNKFSKKGYDKPAKKEFIETESGDFKHKDGDIYPRHVVKRIRPELFK